MKKVTILFIALFVGVCSIAIAEEQDAHQPDTQRSEMRQEEPGGERSEIDQQGPRGQRSDMMSPNKMGKMGGMMGMHPTVVATSDGGVVVLMGGKLAKYDSNLDLVKEVEIKGGSKPMDKRSGNLGMKKPLMPPQDEPMEPASEGSAAKSSSAVNDEKAQ